MLAQAKPINPALGRNHQRSCGIPLWRASEIQISWLPIGKGQARNPLSTSPPRSRDNIPALLIRAGLIVESCWNCWDF